MTELHSILNSVGVGIALLSILWVAAVKITRLEVKVDTIWNFLLNRAVAEGATTGLLTIHSPVKITAKAMQYLDDLKPQLQDLYTKVGRSMSEADFALEVEREFGSQLVKEVCIPNQVTLGVCLIIATAIAMRTDTLEEILSEI